MRRRPEQSLLKVLPEAVVDRKRYNQRRHSRRHPGNRDASDHADESLASFRAKVAGSDEEFKAHGEKAISSSHQLSDTADYSWRRLRDSWDDRGNRVAVLTISIAKPLFQLRVLHLDHQGARCRRERHQPPAHG